MNPGIEVSNHTVPSFYLRQYDERIIGAVVVVTFSDILIFRRILY